MAGHQSLPGVFSHWPNLVSFFSLLLSQYSTLYGFSGRFNRVKSRLSSHTVCHALLWANSHYVQFPRGTTGVRLNNWPLSITPAKHMFDSSSFYISLLLSGGWWYWFFLHTHIIVVCVMIDNYRQRAWRWRTKQSSTTCFFLDQLRAIVYYALILNHSLPKPQVPSGLHTSLQRKRRLLNISYQPA